MMKTKLFKKRVPMLFSAMLTLFALLTATLQAAVMPPLLQPSNNQTLWGSYFYGDYQKGEPTRSYCTPSYNSGSENDGDYIKSFTLTGGVIDINNSDNDFGTNGYNDFTTIIAQAVAEQTLTFTIVPGKSSESLGYAIWIDWDNNETFSNVEVVSSASASTGTKTGSFTVPSTVGDGNYRMRVAVRYNTNPTDSNYGPCESTGYGYGEAEDYTLTISSVTGYGVTAATTITNGSIAFSTDGTTFTSSLSDLDGGETIYVKATADAGYELASMTASGITFSGTGDTRTFTMPTSNVTVSATFSQVSYNVTKGTITGGDITLSASTAHYGDVITITPEADGCYETTPTYTVTDAGSNPVTVTGNTFTMPASDVTVDATFAIQTYNVNLGVCSNGDLYVTGGNVTDHFVNDALYACQVECGSSVTLRIDNIASGSEFLGWSVGGTIVSTANPWTFTATETVSPTPVFGQKYTVTCAATTNGSISADKATAAETETVTITATPATGYELETLTYTPDGGSAVTISGTTFQMPAANVTVNATFTKACGHYYYLVEEDLDDWTGEYLIVYTTGSKAFNGGLATLDAAGNTIAVTISHDTIHRDATTSAAHFDIAKTGDYYTIKSASGSYIGCGKLTSGGGMLQAATPNGSYSGKHQYWHVINYNNGNINIISNENSEGGYLKYNASSGDLRFRYYTQNSQQPIQLYKKGVMKPVITPADGNYFTGTQTVTIAAPDNQATIYYTTDGSTPTEVSTLYTGSFTISTTTTVKAIAVNGCGESSLVATALIRNLDDNVVITPAGGTYFAGTEVTISSPGAFHYTTDGTEPSTTNGTAISGTSKTITLNESMTVRAVLDSDPTKNAKEDYVVPTGTYEGNNPDGIVMNKSVSGNFSNSAASDYGTGNITLESYVTGNVSVQVEAEPVDVVFILDYSGSMKINPIDEHDNTSPTRWDALKAAVPEFLDKLAETNDPTDPHRIAFIQYGTHARLYYKNNSSLDYVQGDGYGYAYSPSIPETYTAAICQNAFFSYSDAVSALQPSNVWNSIKGNNTMGETGIGGAVDIAAQVFAANSSSTHKKILVILTDGAPGNDSWSNTTCDEEASMTNLGAAMANYCLQSVRSIETTYNVETYTIGIFDGADDSFTTLPTYTDYPSGSSSTSQLAANINRYMTLLSSNSNATTMCCDGTSTWTDNHYYKSADDAESLNDVFSGIATAVGGASASLSSHAIVQDVMSGQFAIPEGTTASSITVQTAECTGVSGGDTTWATPVNLPNPNIQFSEDGKTIMVTGFDYASNWVGYNEDASEWHGAKLIVTIPIAFDPSLTDDDVFHGTFATNAAGSGIYDADGMPVGNFPTPTTNVDHGKVTWVQKVTAQPSTWTVTNDTVMIGTENDLAWFISYVNGMNGQTPQPAAKAKLTADLNMSANLWVPIGYNGNHKFTGTFDGNGYTIKGINIPTESAAEYVSWRFNTGMGSGTDNTTGSDSTAYYAMGTPLQYEGFFGYAAENAKINNLFLTGGKFVTDTIANVMIGGVTGASYGSTEISFAESAVELVLSEKATNATIGGIVGHCANNDNCKINAVMAVGDITINGSAKSAGSVSGNLGAVKTFYTNHTISGEGTVTTKNKNFKNGYVRISNEGYDITSANGYTPSQFTAPTAYTYGSYSINNTVNGTPLVDVLNDDSNLASGYKWMRSTSQAINGDYPIIVKAENDGFAIVNDSEDGKIVRYQEINTLLGMEKYQSVNHSVFMYNNDELTTAPSGTKLYIDQNVAMTQSSACGAVNAYVSVTMDNSNGAAEMHRDWHGFAASIAAGKTGISYGSQASTHPTNDNDLTFGTHYSMVQNDDTVYFPNGINAGSQFDLYSFYEPEYHWINLKRASNNHWHQDNDDQIFYTNETTFTPGKGYFVALGDKTDNDNNLMQAYGTLNNSEAGFTVPITNTGAHLQGYNLLGNPFQSYLDFNAFAETNKNIWASTSSMGYKSYMIYDADKGGFREYLTDGSQSFSQNAAQDAPRYINMHQAFFVVKDGTASTVTFKNSMRVTDATVADGTSFRDVKPAYPLVNLFCTDEDGKQEISVVELNRPEMAGSLKMKGMLNGKCNMYLHWNNEDFGSMFIDHTPDYVPVWFDAAEDGVFTISWNTQNAAFGYVHFVDNMTGADIDCLEADSYTFEARTNDMSARFRLVFSPLGVEDITTENGENFAFFNGSELVVNGEGELSLIDLNGRVLTTTFVSGQQSNVMLPTVAEGMYLLRLTRANGVKVQKIVIRK